MEDGWETAGRKKKGGKKKEVEAAEENEAPAQDVAQEPAAKADAKVSDDGFQEAAPKKKKNRGNKNKEEKDPFPEEQEEEAPKASPAASPTIHPADPPKKEAAAKPKAESKAKAKAKGKAEAAPKQEAAKPAVEGVDWKLALEALKEDSGEKLREAFANAEPSEINATVDEDGYLGKEKSVTVTKFTKLESFNCDTVLHLAVRNKKLQVARACLDLGIDMGLTNKPGKINGKVQKGQTAAEQDEHGMIAKAKEGIELDKKRHEEMIKEEGGAMPSAKKLKKKIKECQTDIEKMEATLKEKQDEILWLQREEKEAKRLEAAERAATKGSGS